MASKHTEPEELSPAKRFLARQRERKLHRARGGAAGLVAGRLGAIGAVLLAAALILTVASLATGVPFEFLSLPYLTTVSTLGTALLAAAGLGLLIAPTPPLPGRKGRDSPFLIGDPDDDPWHWKVK